MLEMELKFEVESFDKVESALRERGVEPGSAVQERNFVLDLMGQPLGMSDTLFRLRNCTGGTLLTVKKPLPATALKVRQERETVLQCSLEDAIEIFGLLGYGVVYRYEKTRRECRLGKAAVCLDQLWFGRFVEIEAASEEDVMRAVEDLGFDPLLGIRFSYAALEKDARERSGTGAPKP